MRPRRLSAQPTSSRPALPARWWKLRTDPNAPPSALHLALQGGGAHGAFTWGVLDALLQDIRLVPGAMSGSSAGAINAVLLAHGWMLDGRAGARAALTDFWTDVGRQIPSTMTQGNGDDIALSPMTKMLAHWVSLFSPGDLNPLDISPLRNLLKKAIDFEGLRKHSPFALYVGATHTNTGRLRLFREHELTLDMLLASACLPKIHHAVDIDGEPYWDGGYAANPAVFPLVQEGKTCDILLVLLAPHQHSHTPHKIDAINERIQDLGFKTHFLREMQMYARSRLAHPPRFHLIDSNHLAVLQRSETKMLAHAPFLEMLHGQGREHAQRWLSEHADAVGRHSTVDLAQWLD